MYGVCRLAFSEQIYVQTTYVYKYKLYMYICLLKLMHSME